MMQRKGIPRSSSNASYFHGKGALLPTTTTKRTTDRKVAPGTRRQLRRPPSMNGTGSSANHCNITTSSSNQTTPNTTNTAAAAATKKKHKRVIGDVGIGSISVATVGRVFAICAIVLVTTIIVRNVGSTAEDLEELAKATSRQNNNLRSIYWRTLDDKKLPLSDYPSIQYALDHSDITLLYFAASWCPMSTPVTQLLDEKFGDIFLPTDQNSVVKRRPISLVYVSSDETEEQMNQYVGARNNWLTIPAKERTALKQHFQVAAKREMASLQMETRLQEVPTIIIVSGESHNVVTTHGVDDLKEKGPEALIHWIKLLHTVKALEDKYY